MRERAALFFGLAICCGCAGAKPVRETPELEQIREAGIRAVIAKTRYEATPEAVQTSDLFAVGNGVI